MPIPPTIPTPPPPQHQNSQNLPKKKKKKRKKLKKKKKTNCNIQQQSKQSDHPQQPTIMLSNNNHQQMMYQNNKKYLTTSDTIIYTISWRNRIQVFFAILGLCFFGLAACFAGFWVLQHQGREIFGVKGLGEVGVLPFCVLVMPDQQQSQPQIIQTIQSQNYPNTTILQIPAPISFSSTKSSILSSCPKNSVLLFTSSPLQAGSLKYLNQQFQHYKVWLLYSSNSGQKKIMAVFYRIFQLLGINDFDGSNFVYLQNWDRGVIATGMMELADKFSMEVDGGRVFLGVGGYFGVDQVSQPRTKYTYILRLSQDYPAKIGFFTRKSLNEEHKNSQSLWIGKTQLQHARDRVQTLYLPKQHSIHKIQRNYFSEKYRIPEQPQEQLPICLTILSHNNIQNRRYIKVIDSILQQEYQNYHIVFFDDRSDDLTMVKTIQYLQQIGFPMNRTKFVQGLKRNFATYNIINSAYNFCGDNEIQLLMDGDDELIGTQVFRLYNSLFVKHPDLWLIYSTFQSNQYDLGWTIITKFQSQIGDGTKRINLGGMSPVRAWRVQLIRSIPLMYHLDSNHEWLDTLYDDALAQCLFQLSGIDRILYMPQLLLDYNTNYGDNDNSSEQKSQHRVAVYKYMHSLPALKQLKQLSNKSKQIEVENILKKDLNDRYRVFDIDDL